MNVYHFYLIGYIISTILWSLFFLFCIRTEKGEPDFGFFGSFVLAATISFTSWLGILFVIVAYKSWNGTQVTKKPQGVDSNSQPMSALEAYQVSTSNQDIKQQEEEKICQAQLEFIFYRIKNAVKKGDYTVTITPYNLQLKTQEKLEKLGYSVETRAYGKTPFVIITWENIKKK